MMPPFALAGVPTSQLYGIYISTQDLGGTNNPFFLIQHGQLFHIEFQMLLENELSSDWKNIESAMIIKICHQQRHFKKHIYVVNSLLPHLQQASYCVNVKGEAEGRSWS
jgi:hypothetical protein